MGAVGTRCRPPVRPATAAGTATAATASSARPEKTRITSTTGAVPPRRGPRTLRQWPAVGMTWRSGRHYPSGPSRRRRSPGADGPTFVTGGDEHAVTLQLQLRTPSPGIVGREASDIVAAAADPARVASMVAGVGLGRSAPPGSSRPVPRRRRHRRRPGRVAGRGARVSEIFHEAQLGARFRPVGDPNGTGPGHRATDLRPVPVVRRPGRQRLDRAGDHHPPARPGMRS